MLLYWSPVWRYDPENLGKEVLFQVGSSCIMVSYLQLMVYWIEMVRNFETNTLRKKSFGISRRKQLFVIAYACLYAVATVSLMAVRVATNKPVFKLLVSGVDALVLISCIVPYIYYGRKLVKVLEGMSRSSLIKEATGSLDEKDRKQREKLWYLTEMILRGASVGCVFWLAIVAYAVTKSNFYLWPWYAQTFVHRCLELAFVFCAMQIVHPRKASDEAKRRRKAKRVLPDTQKSAASTIAFSGNEAEYKAAQAAKAQGGSKVVPAPDEATVVSSHVGASASGMSTAKSSDDATSAAVNTTQVIESSTFESSTFESSTTKLMGT